MKRNWQESSHDAKAGRWASVYVTMNPKGEIHISRHTYLLLGEPEAFRLLFDRANSTIGMQPTRKVMANAYPAGRRGRHRGRVIRGFGFVQEFAIRLNETVRFIAPEIDEDGILVLDLRKVKSASRPRPAAAGSELRLQP